MRKLFYLVIVTTILFGCQSSKQLSNTNDAKEYQKILEESYNNPKTTPLIGEEKANFHGMTFFPISNKYIVKATYTPIKQGKIIPFPTSAKKIKYYKEYGVVEFVIDGKPQKLIVYQPSPIIEKYKENLFLPFMDETNGITSYGGGRYLDLSTKNLGKKSTKIIVDFNKVYNPYCAYSKHYNCPIPPANNVLDVEINAGVSYHK